MTIRKDNNPMAATEIVLAILNNKEVEYIVAEGIILKNLLHTLTCLSFVKPTLLHSFIYLPIFHNKTYSTHYMNVLSRIAIHSYNIRPFSLFNRSCFICNTN